MQTVQRLFRDAVAKCGTQAELARRLNVTPPNLHGMITGTRPTTPETVAALCDVLELPGDECRQMIAAAIIENPKNERRRGMLRRALFRCGATGGVALLAYLAAASITYPNGLTLNSLYIVAHLLRAIKRRALALARTIDSRPRSAKVTLSGYFPAGVNTA
jgi:DNA-binding transcriptional regulator YdaS (Cro superfamily)